MNLRRNQALAADMRRLRPIAVGVLATLEVLPSLFELATGNLSAVTLLWRLALALFVSTVLVWVATGVVLHYAQVQARTRREAPATREFEH